MPAQPATRTLDDLVWEQALESALRQRLTTIEEVISALDSATHSRLPGAGRIRRVLALRPDSAPPTESLLETLMVQLARARAKNERIASAEGRP